ncbi:unnamed protein product (macronuclear) [Paramecium tetraurelia]|uniref:Uncharacterized protein n=1 Tax=Paramecium tetraurelia TaxID=5888 RepID=A0CYI9_PARTE|nr:uncharacterized protein GSPATT00011456001 [Paramecium tetraurelia]CAK75856.1 unnamed protein product [Paramecium tetraurelia]|eukprot:XP_001443253.1 hypothetical protein (macronuclear) [Paramecium tetraurelia strain d4-2]
MDPNHSRKPSQNARALTLADLDQQSISEDSAMDLDQSQLHRLGIDISNIQAADVTQNDEPSKSIMHFSKKNSDSTTNVDLTQHIFQFKQKIQDLQLELGSDRSDPYEISIHSFKNQEDNSQNKGLCVSEALGTNINSQNQLKNQDQQNSTSYQFKAPNTSLSSGGLSYNLPHLNSTGNKAPLNANPIGNLYEQLEYHRLKFYDSYMPEQHKVLNNPLKFLKYKLHQQNRYAFDHCLDCLIH